MFDMTLGHANYGVIENEANPMLHRCGTLAGRSCCGKAIVSISAAQRTNLTMCRRCAVLADARDEGLAAARDEGLTEWF